MIKNRCLCSIFGYYIPILIGFLIGDGISCAPDLLIKTKGIILPIEIKTMICDYSYNNDVRRAINIATKQLKTAKKCLGNQLYYCIYTYIKLLILIYIFSFIFDGLFFKIFSIVNIIYKTIKTIQTYNTTGIIALYWVKTHSITFYKI